MPSAYVLISCTLGSDKEIISRLMEIPVVIQAYRVYGAYDIIVAWDRKSSLSLPINEEAQEIIRRDGFLYFQEEAK